MSFATLESCQFKSSYLATASILSFWVLALARWLLGYVGNLVLVPCHRCSVTGLLHLQPADATRTSHQLTALPLAGSGEEAPRLNPGP